MATRCLSSVVKPQTPKTRLPAMIGEEIAWFRMRATKYGKFPKLPACSRLKAGESQPPVGENQFLGSPWRGEYTRGGVSQPFYLPWELSSEFHPCHNPGRSGLRPLFLIVGDDQEIFENNRRYRKAMSSFYTAKIFFQINLPLWEWAVTMSSSV